MIERTMPIQMHKGLVINVLTNNPEDMQQFFPEWKGTVEELIAFLNDDPREWFWGDEFITDAERQERIKAAESQFSGRKKVVKPCP